MSIKLLLSLDNNSQGQSSSSSKGSAEELLQLSCMSVLLKNVIRAGHCTIPPYPLWVLELPSSQPVWATLIPLFLLSTIHHHFHSVVASYCGRAQNPDVLRLKKFYGKVCLRRQSKAAGFWTLCKSGAICIQSPEPFPPLRYHVGHNYGCSPRGVKRDTRIAVQLPHTFPYTFHVAFCYCTCLSQLLKLKEREIHFHCQGIRPFSISYWWQEHLNIDLSHSCTTLFKYMDNVFLIKRPGIEIVRCFREHSIWGFPDMVINLLGMLFLLLNYRTERVRGPKSSIPVDPMNSPTNNLLNLESREFLLIYSKGQP